MSIQENNSTKTRSIHKGNAMHPTTAKNDDTPVSQPRPLKETLWNIFGIVFYITVAVGAVYHLLIPYLKP